MKLVMGAELGGQYGGCSDSRYGAVRCNPGPCGGNDTVMRVEQRAMHGWAGGRLRANA
jgi:hypothetical protein